MRRKRNKVHGLNLPSGIWCTDLDVLQVKAVNYFKNLFCNVENVGARPTVSHINPLEDEGRRALVKPVTKEEVHKALMSMKSYKSLDPDGFQPIFYKIFWRFIRDSFMYGEFSAPVTDNLMVLIPKVDHPLSFKDFRPISLCNVLYKLITKVLVNRLRPFLQDMISPLQSSFIPRRGTADNAILLQTIVHHM